MTLANLALTLLGTVAAASLITACAEEAKAPAPAPVDAPQPVPATATGAAATTGEQRLEPMTHAEFTGVIPPGLGCSFADRRNASPLVVAAHAESGADAVVKLNGTLVRLEAAADGHDALVAGPVLRSEALEVRILRTPGDGSQTGIESVVWPAEMIVAQDETGEIDRRQGEWMCGA